jgi:glucose/arabinose dehydrogenase
MLSRWRKLALAIGVFADMVFATRAAETKLVARHDPADQLFRRAPMAESARSVVVSLETNLHAAFDTELGRVHTIWRGGPLNLWGPPYSNSKSPFICDFEGERVYTFPKFSPWFAGSTQLAVNFRGIRSEGGLAKFEYDIVTEGNPVRVVESVAGGTEGQNWMVKRRWEFPKGCSEELRYMAFAEGGVNKELFPQNKWAGTNGVVSFRSGGEVGDWLIFVEQVNYGSEIITEAGTEKGNPTVRYSGEETRAYVGIAKREAPFSFEITIGSPRKPLELKMREKTVLKRHGADVAERKDSGDAHYRLEHFPLPASAEMMITGMDWLNGKDLAVSTWLGEIYVVENATGAATGATYRRFARGLNEPLGLTVVKGEILVVQKGELTRIVDKDGDGEAEVFECLNDDWGYSGNYHSYSFGPLVTPANELMVFVTGQRGRADMMYQGWALNVNERGAEPFCSGLRVPHGWELYRGDIFVTDNQGNWIGTCRLNHLREGKFYGYPSSKPATKKVYRAEEVELPVLWLPRVLSPSASGIETIETDAFGPFKGQMLIGDFQNSIVMRAFLEKVNGKWQGVVFPFAKGFLSGVNRLAMGADGKLYVGGGKRTWSTAAPKEYSLDRVSFTGKVPFEVSEVRALKDGFEMRFTKPLELEPARDGENYLVKQFTYEYHEAYGSPEFDHEGKVGATEVKVDSVEVSADGKVVRLKMDGLKTGFVTSFQLAVNSAENEDLRNDTFYYTLNEQPR